jgi:hypothetical protein
MTRLNITIPGQPELSFAVRRVVEAALDQHAPSPRLTRAVNIVLDLADHELSTKRARKGVAA